jgi:prepilin-type N-terminal cleavage/methylation domain-containing protein
MKGQPIQLENRIVEKFNFLTGFTLVELIVVVLVAGILASFALPQFAVTKERALDKEAKSVLALVRAAEKIYKMEQGTYFPNGGINNDPTQINIALKLSLPNPGTNWLITLHNAGAGFAEATRTVAPVRRWRIDYPGDADPTCFGGGCP